MPDENGHPAPQLLQYSSGAEPVSRWTTVWLARNSFEANLAVGKLLDQGIHARTDMENAASLGAWAGTGPTGTNVQVMLPDVEAARKVLEAIDANRAKRQLAESVQCSQCAAYPAKRSMPSVRYVGIYGMILAVVVGIGMQVLLPESGLTPIVVLVILAVAAWGFLVTASPNWRCLNCGHAWSQPDPVETEDDDDEEDDDDANGRRRTSQDANN